MCEINKVPLEIERKFIIKMPNTETMKKEECYTVSSILQIYLESESRVTHRVRKRSYSDSMKYTETKKIRIDKMTAIEDESEISEEKFNLLKEKIKSGTSPLNKVRHTFDKNGFTFEVDIYPQWKNTAIMEVELKDSKAVIEYPDFIEIIKEVTGESEYSNAAMSQSFPKESVI